MATIEKVEDIIAWQKACILCNEIHEISINTGLKTDFALRNQINRSCGSVMDNIAEEFGRGSNTEFVRFLEISYASACECQSQLYRLLDKQYINEDKLKDLTKVVLEIKKMTMKLMDYLSKSPNLGVKSRLRDNNRGPAS